MCLQPENRRVITKEMINVQAQTVQNRSFASLLLALMAASVLLVGGVAGYAIRAVIASSPTVQQAHAPDISGDTSRARQFGQQP
jgi:hypothetical protein